MIASGHQFQHFETISFAYWMRRPATIGWFSAFLFWWKCYLRRWKRLFFQSTLFILFDNLSIFGQKHLTINVKKTKRHFQEIWSFDTHSTANLPPLVIFKTSSFFGKKLIFYSKTNQIFGSFEKFYYFSRILRLICYYLVEKITVKTVERYHWQRA